MKNPESKANRDKLEIRVSCDLPNHLSKTQAKERIVEAIKAISELDPKSIKVQFI